jgi:magnesium transporter
VAADVMAPVIARMDQRDAANVLASLDPDRASDLVGALSPPRAGLLLRRLPESAREAILDALGGRPAAVIREALRYPAGTAAALCDPHAVTVLADQTVGEAIDAVRQAGRAYYYVFVLDREQRLQGVVDLRDLLGAEPGATLASVARGEVVRLQGSTSFSSLLVHPSWQELHALPVVDASGRFLGLLRHKTLRRLESEARSAPGQAAVTLALGLGELFWGAGSAAVGEVARALAPLVDPPPEDPVG